MQNTLARDLFDRPVLIVSTPRSGSTLLFETLSQAADLFTTRSENHQIIERIPGLAPVARGWDSNRLEAEDLTPQTGEWLAASLYDAVCDRSGARPSGRVRLIEKTPKNALRVPFFHALWPDALFVYLYREPRNTLASMIRGWQSGRFRTYPRLPDWSGIPWSFLLVPGWRDLGGLPLTQIVARQWAITTETLIDDLSAIPSTQLRAVDYDDFVAAPQEVVNSLVPSLALRWDRQLPPNLPLSRFTLTPPRPDKWRSLESDINAILPIVADADERARTFKYDKSEST